MIEFLLRVVAETWSILTEASVFLLFGLALAGVLGVLIPTRTLMRFFGTGRVKSVLWGATLGAPLPLCSCGVLPTALALRKRGATKGATVSFLVATPETGVDSISLSYALLDPIMTVFRPVSAWMTAVSAGLATNFFGESRRSRDAAAGAAPSDHGEAGCTDCAHDHGHDHGHDLIGAAEEAGQGPRPRLASRETVRGVYRFAFRGLLDETSYWLTLGFILSGVLAASLPDAFFEDHLGTGLLSMLVMLLVAVPVYTCAAAATPVAAAFVLKGLNPGAALVYLLAGPATYIGSLMVLTKFLGPRVVAIYLATIVVMALAAGLAVNWVYYAWALDPQSTFGAATAIVPEPLKIAGAVILIGLLLTSMRRTHLPREWIWLGERLAGLSGIALTGARLKGAAIAALLALYLGSGLFVVRPGEVGVVQRFGAITAGPLEPGLHYRLPWPMEGHRIIEQDLVRRAELGFRSGTSGSLSERARARDQLTVAGPGNPVPQRIRADGLLFQRQAVGEEALLLTGDVNLVDLRFTVQYRVEAPLDFAYNVAEPDELVRSLTLAAVRGAVGTSGVDEVYTSARREIELEVAAAVQRLLDRYRAGIEVVSVRLLHVHAPDEVHDAFRDVASAREDKLRTINRAHMFAVEKINLAEGEAAAMIEAAEAFREEKILRAQGDAAAFTLKVEAYRDAPELTRFRLQLETVEEVLPGISKLVRPGADEVGEFDLWLMNPFAERR
jgi:HflK protein